MVVCQGQPVFYSEKTKNGLLVQTLGCKIFSPFW